MPTKTKNIEQDFLRKLKKFAAHGYAFDADRGLRPGTRQNRDAKGTQREAFDAYTKGLEEGHRHGYFEIPTGVGKTVLFLALVKNYLDAVDGKKNGPRSLIVVPSEKLAVQTAQALAKFLPDLAPTIETDDDQGKEIDWKNSHIGLQYGKVKHADRKPRVLITTYQSLNRDRENKTYPPSEYGMVIYDEGHALTAAQYGLAVDKFKDSIQLAVSATPEYSEEKTVSSRLQHRYYHLSIADAINRGDLCNVRPVLLKTNYTVDKVKFKQYVEQRKGAPLTDAQLTALLNEQTRNRAAMETYLLGADPDSGERYLGQNGMIFCGSTDHVDDFARQFDDLISKPKYHPVRQWLNEEGIELIAPVHGKIKGAWLKKGLLTNGKGRPITEGREYDGNKEWYSEEEIFNLHAKGKILVLASVKKLKEGYDSPRDSIIIDTVDRLSKVDATQIVGRGFRLNPPNPEDNDPGNPDKTCTVINMVDRNTHELYADKPQMLPIYCAEIIEGAEFRKPMRRKHLTQRFAKQPPEINATLEDSGFKLETDIEKVRGISAQNKKKRDEAEPKGKPEGYWSGGDLMRAIGSTTVNNSLVILRKIKTQLEERKETDYLRVTIPKDAIKTVINDAGTHIYIKEEYGKKVAAAYKASRKSTDIWTGTDLTNAIGFKSPVVGTNIIHELRTQLETAKTAEYKGIMIPKTAIVEYQERGRKRWGIQKEYGIKIANACKEIKKTDDIVSGIELSSLIRTSNSALENTSDGVGVTILKNLKEQRDEGKRSLIYKDLHIPRSALVDYQSDNAMSCGLQKEYAQKIAESYANNVKPSNVLSIAEFAESLELSEGGAKYILKKIKERMKKGMSDYLGVSVPEEALVAYDSNGRSTFGIKETYGSQIAVAYKRSKSKEGKDDDKHLKSPPISPRKSPAHMSKEEREAEKRGGRER